MSNNLLLPASPAPETSSPLPGASAASAPGLAAADRAPRDGMPPVEQTTVDSTAKTDEPAADEAPGARERKGMKDAAGGYVGGGRPASEANFYSGVGGVHLGHGDVNNYNYYTGAAQTDRGYSVERMLPGLIEKIRAVYVKPMPLYDIARTRLADNRVLVLHGEASMGKLATAIHLLADAFGYDELFEVSSRANLDDTKVFPDDKRRGYVIGRMTAAAAATFDASAARRLGGKLREHESHLIVTLHRRIKPDETLGAYVLPWDDIPDRGEMLRRHVAWHARQVGVSDILMRMCADSRVRDVLANLSVAQIDALAADLVGKNVDLDQVLEAYRVGPREQVAQWFAANDRLDRRTFMIALAVFHAGRYQSAVAADLELQKLIKPPPKEDAPPEPSPIFDATRSQILQAVGAEIKLTPEKAEVGPCVVERVYLKEPTFQKFVLYYSWHEYPALRPFLLRWLRQLGLSDDPEARWRAAAALGQLGEYDLAALYNEVLLPCASEPGASARELAALALGVLSASPEVGASTRDLLHRWSEDESVRLRWTTALAYGLFAGRDAPGDALLDLRVIGEAGSPGLASVVGNSVADLFALGQKSPLYYLRVIESLRVWVVNAKGAAKASIWLNVFTQLASEVKHQDLSGVVQPAMLWIYQNDLKAAAAIRSLLRRALNAGNTRESTLQAIRAWVDTADNISQLEQTLKDLFVDLSREGSGHERDRLHFWLQRWAMDVKQPSEVAERLLPIFQ